MSAEHQALLEAARQAARQAAEAILKVYATPFDVRHKADESPVTLADEQAERAHREQECDDRHRDRPQHLTTPIAGIDEPRRRIHCLLSTTKPLPCAYNQ